MPAPRMAEAQEEVGGELASLVVWLGGKGLKAAPGWSSQRWEPQRLERGPGLPFPHHNKHASLGSRVTPWPSPCSMASLCPCLILSVVHCGESVQAEPFP